MKTKLQRLLAVSLSLIFILALMAGCQSTGQNTSGNQNTDNPATAAATEAPQTTEQAATAEPQATTEAQATVAPSNKDLYTIKILTGPTKLKASDEMAVGKVIKDKFGIVFEYVSYTGDIREKQNLMLAAGDYNEIQYMQREDIVLNYVKAGALLDLDQYLDKMPDFKTRFKDIMPYWRLSGDGKLYKWETSIPRELDSDIEVNDVLVRTDALEKQNWANPVSADNWVAFIKQAIKDFPEAAGQPTVGMTAPLAESWGLAGIATCLYEKGSDYYAISNEGYTFNLQKNTFEDYFKNPYVKESLQFFNKLYQEGLLDEECFTDTGDKTQEKLNQGRSICAWYTVWNQGTANAELQKNGTPEMQYINLPVQSNAQVAAKQKREIRMETTRPFDSYGMTKNCKQPDRIIELLNWACTDEGQITLRSGIEGVHWKNENGKRVYTDEFIKAKQDPDYNLTQGLGYFTMLPTFNLLAADGQPHDLSCDVSFIDQYSLTDRQKEAFQKMGWSSSKQWYIDNGQKIYTGLSGSIYVDPTTDLGKVHQKMTELRVKYSAKLIMASSDQEYEQIYQEAMTEYDKLNPQSVIDEFNRLYAEKAAVVEQYKNEYK